MSRRFGRNQKRAMRAQIAVLEQRVNDFQFHTQQLEALMQIKNQKISELETVTERTAQVLGDHFATLPLKTQELTGIPNLFKVSIFKPHLHRYAEINEAVLDALEYINMDTHQTFVRIDELRGMVHMRCRSIGGDVAYALSDQAYRKLSEAHLVDLISQQIAPEMAKQLIRERKKRYL